ncbi:MAG: NAD-dependent protein deacylase [Candidatus Hydrogenedentota bacterium]|nr:MAG: NAD-dependent protein deacylase [Candidatus Hydrogenedentota bacterium]
MPTYQQMVEEIAHHLQNAGRLLFITGAGISAESGLPTYRGIGGLYEGNLTEMNLPIEEVLSGHMFSARPEVVWKFILQIEKATRGATYNKAHKIIADLQENHEVWVLTQNIDGFHHAAGSKNVIDIHGDIHSILCTRCDYQTQVPDYSGFTEIPPLCPNCSAVLRPDVVLFGEMLPAKKVALLERELSKGFDMVFSVGTTSVFPYIAAPVYDAAREGIPTVEINPTETSVSTIVDYKLAEKASIALSDIMHTLNAHLPS